MSQIVYNLYNIQLGFVGAVVVVGVAAAATILEK